MHDRAKMSPVSPVAADLFRGRARDPIESIGDIAERSRLDLEPLLYLLLDIPGVEVSAHLVEEEGERVEQRRRVRRRHWAVGDPREESLRHGLEARLLLRLPTERVEDALAVVDAAGR